MYAIICISMYSANASLKTWPILSLAMLLSLLYSQTNVNKPNMYKKVGL